MPRGFFGSRRRTAAPKPIKVKPIKVPVAGLQSAYEFLLLDSMKGLEQARQWYAENIPSMLIGNPLTVDEHKTYEKAVKALSLGDKTSVSGEREQAYRTAFRLCEKLFAKHNLPTIDKAFADRDARKQPPRRLLLAHRAVTALNQVFAGHGMTFEMSTGKERVLTEDNKVLIPIDTLAGEGLLQTILGEVLEVAKVMSITTVTGKPELDGDLLFAAIPNLLKGCATWAGTVPPKDLFATAKAATVSTAPRTSAPRAPQQPLPKGLPDVGIPGKKTYRAGTTNAAVWTLLSDQQPHSLRECYDTALAAGAKYERDALWYVMTDGKKTGAWEVTKTKGATDALSTVTMHIK